LLDETVPVFPCEQPLDIVILNDVSGSVDAVEYAESKQFFVDFLNEANIGLGTEDSRAAIIEWSSSSLQSIKIPITGVIADLQDYVNMSRSFSGGTDPQSAMNYGRNYLDAVARPDEEKVLVLSTDAFPNQVSTSLIALADQFKAEGYHIITIAFDDAFSNSSTRNILRQVASINLLAPGAPAYSLLDQNLAQNIVNLYLCPIDPGSSATVYFNRDGEILITDIQPVGFCLNPEAVEITFTVEAKRELSLPSGTPVSFYYNNPELFGSTPILTWLIPCAIPVGTTETFTVTLPVSTAANIYAVLNDDGSQSPAIAFPITDIDELAYSNNIDNVSICTNPIATLQALKYTTTPTPICNNTVIYTVDVCNISSVDAIGVTITDVAPASFVLQGTSINDNGCATDNGTDFDIPANCCVSIIYTYDASAAANDNYNDQDVNLGGPGGQTYISFDGINTTSEDVLIDGTLDCPSTIISFSKDVNTTDICEDGFVVYTFTIDNQLNVPLQGIEFTDVLPSPVNWTFQPYNLQGLSISTSSVLGNTASFNIDEVDANTVATFSMDANLGDWTMDGMLSNTATLTNIPDLNNGGFQTLTSNTTTTNVSTKPEITLPDILYIETTETMVSLDASLIGATNITWTTVGDGIFSSTNTSASTYTFGTDDFINEEVSLFVSTISDCGEDGQNVLVILVPPCEITIDNMIIGNCNDNGTNANPIDDTYEVTLNAINGNVNNTYIVNDGSSNYGPFTYGINETITLPADGNTYNLTLTDSDDATCFAVTSVSQNSCSNACSLTIVDATVGVCNPNGTESDSSDDTYETNVNASALNAGISNQFIVSEGVNILGTFTYNVGGIITLPADGNLYTITFADADNSSCFTTTQVNQNSCSNTCSLAIIDAIIGVRNPNGTVSDPSDDTYEINVNASALNPGISNQFIVSEGSNILGTFVYNTGGIITLPADGNLYAITFADTDDSSCFIETQVSQISCSNTCFLFITTVTIGDCNDNGTNTDPTDDTYEVIISASALNGGVNGACFVDDGINTYEPFPYGWMETITLPSDGNIYTLTFTDINDPNCTNQINLSQGPCSTTATIELNGKFLNYAIFPNPTNNNFQIEIRGNTEPLDIQIYNTIGQKILEMEMVENAMVNTSIWAKGMYSIVIYDKNGKILGVEKLLKVE
jgi:uncharacterized repeat protein (TIGR01451 family)